MSEQPSLTQLINEVREKSKAINPTPLIKRDFIEIGNSNKGNLDKQSESFSSSSVTEDAPENDDVVRIMQWNLLAQGLCQGSDGFVLCPCGALDWDYRQHHMLEELLTYSVDIYCLEEVDHFLFLQQYLHTLGFNGVFFPKPDSPCLYQSNNNGPDGCAVFWRENKLSLVGHESIILRNDKGQETNQVALLCRLQIKAGHMKGKEFMCAVTHLKSKPGYENLRWQQGKCLENLLTENVGRTPLILCGDFNAEPQEKAVGVINSSILGLCSAYTLLSKEGMEPPYTTWKVRAGKKNEHQNEVCHTIDYLFFTRKDFECLRLLKFPTVQEIGPGYLPSFAYPSDHLSLVADLRLIF